MPDSVKKDFHHLEPVREILEKIAEILEEEGYVKPFEKLAVLEEIKKQEGTL